MKVLFINQYSNGLNHPGHKRHIYLVNELNKKNLSADLLTSNMSYIDGRKLNYQSDKNIKIVPSHFKNTGRISKVLSYFEFTIRVLLTFNFKNYDVIYCSSPNIISAFVLRLKAKIQRKRFFLEIRDIWPLSLVELGVINNNGLVHKILRSIESNLLRYSDGIIYTMPNFSKYLIDHGLDSKKNMYLPQITDTFNNNITSKRDYIYIGSSKDNDKIIETITTFNSFNSRFKYVYKLDIFIDGENKENIRKFLDMHDYKNISLQNFISDRESLCKKISEYKYGITNFENLDLYKYGISFNKIIDYISGNTIPIIPYIEGCDESIKSICIYSTSYDDPFLDCLLKSVAISSSDHEKMCIRCKNIKSKFNVSIYISELLNFMKA